MKRYIENKNEILQQRKDKYKLLRDNYIEIDKRLKALEKKLNSLNV